MAKLKNAGGSDGEMMAEVLRRYEEPYVAALSDRVAKDLLEWETALLRERGQNGEAESREA